MKIGFIGLGNVGGKLAGSLFRNKFDLTVYDLDKSVADEFKSKGVKVANSVGDLVKNVDVIITCLPSPKICSEVMLNKDGILNNISIEIRNDLLCNRKRINKYIELLSEVLREFAYD